MDSSLKYNRTTLGRCWSSLFLESSDLRKQLKNIVQQEGGTHEHMVSNKNETRICFQILPSSFCSLGHFS